MGRRKSRKPRDEVVNLDECIENADWTKRTWDLHGINSKEDLYRWLGEGQEGFEERLENFKRLPVYRWNKDKPGFEWLKDV
ncbi:MAG: hypothetical protein H5U02_01475 [Clostridia bacterium]|nr:hypothetical protein [Clostridia bacterium]